MGQGYGACIGEVMGTFNCSICGRSTKKPHTHDLGSLTRWVLCSERMPRDIGQYLVTDGHKTPFGQLTTATLFWNGKYWHYEGLENLSIPQEILKAWLDGVPEFKG